MKTIQRGIISTSLILICFCSYAVTKTWIGLATGNWNNGANWLPAGVPATGDDIIFNTTAAVSIDIASPIDLNSLHFINNCVVVFDCNSTKNFRLASTSLLNPALLIEAGSTFTFDATNAGTNNSTLDLTVSPGSTGSISGTLNISCTGGAANGPKLDTYNSATEYGVVTVTTGGIIRILPDADNTESSLIPVPTIVMATGSVYENLKNGGSFPEGTWAANSLARALSPGPIGPSFNGAAYGNLEWNCPNQTTIAFLNADVSFNNVDFISTNNTAFRVKTGATGGIYTMTINGNLIVSNTSVLETSGPTVIAGNGGRIHLKGNLFNLGSMGDNGLPGTVNELELNGTINQTISTTGTGVLSGDELLFIMNNPAGATLISPLTLPHNLVLTAGKITTTPAFLLTMLDGKTATGATIASFVQGPMKKIGDDDFGFPIGEGGIFAPISIQNSGGQSPMDEFTAQYHRLNPQTNVGPIIQNPPLDHISYVEYWTLDRNLGSIAVKIVGLAVNVVSFATDDLALRVARHDGAIWVNEDRSGFIAGPPAPPYITGALFSLPVSNFSPFTIASTDPAPINPLPLIFVSFIAYKNNGDALLNWKLAETPAAIVSFDIERSTDGRNFRKIGTVISASTSEYKFTDFDLPAGISYYRIKAKDPSGKTTLSETEAIISEEKGIYVIRIYPNPVKDIAKLKVVSVKTIITEFAVLDMNGKAVMRFRLSVPEGNSLLSINLAGLPSGKYIISAKGGDKSRFSAIIIKQ